MHTSLIPKYLDLDDNFSDHFMHFVSLFTTPVTSRKLCDPLLWLQSEGKQVHGTGISWSHENRFSLGVLLFEGICCPSLCSVMIHFFFFFWHSTIPQWCFDKRLNCVLLAACRYYCNLTCTVLIKSKFTLCDSLGGVMSITFTQHCIMLMRFAASLVPKLCTRWWRKLCIMLNRFLWLEDNLNMIWCRLGIVNAIN